MSKKIGLPHIGTAAILRSPNQETRAIALAHNDAMLALQGHLAKVPRVDYVVVHDTGAHDTPFSVIHKLGSTPVFVNAMVINADARIYMMADDLREWDDQRVRLRCSASNIQLVLRVEA